jgi:hypothetical protein
MAIELAGARREETHHNGLADQLRTRASNALSNQKHRATQGLGTIVEAVRNTGRQLGDTNQSGIARYVNNAADSLQRWAETIERKDVREIVEDVQRFGRRQPALLIGLSFGAGLLGARFLKSSAREEEYGQRDIYTAHRTTGTIRGTSYGSTTAADLR